VIRRPVVLGILLALLGGCGGSPALVVPATHGTIDLTFTLGATGAGTSFVGDVSMAGNVGTVVLGGRRLPALAYGASLDPRSFDTYVLLAVAPERWYIVYLYCHAGQLFDVWYETPASASLFEEGATGVCDERPFTAIKVPVDLPGTTMAQPPPLHGFEVTGAGVSIPDARPGWVVFGQTRYDVFVYAAVDCTTICGDPGWRELHAVLRDGTTNRTGIGTFYLFTNPNQVFVEYALTLPDLAQPVGQGRYLDGATWSAS
jgi:hypothetical protein